MALPQYELQDSFEGSKRTLSDKLGETISLTRDRRREQREQHNYRGSIRCYCVMVKGQNLGRAVRRQPHNSSVTEMEYRLNADQNFLHMWL